MGVPPGLHLGVGQRMRTGGIREVDRVIARPGVRVGGPARPQDGGQGIARQEGPGGRVVHARPQPGQPVHAQGPGARQPHPVRTVRTGRADDGARLPQPGTGVAPGTLVHQPPAPGPARTQGETDINNRELTQLRNHPAAGGLVPHHLPPVHTGQLPQTIHTQLVDGGPPRTGRGDPPLVDPQ